MKPTTVVVTAASGVTTASNWVCMDRLPDDIEISFGVTVTTAGSGFGSYTVQHTFINVPLLGTAAITAQDIFDHPTVSGQSAAADGNYAYPVAAIRVLQVGGSGSGNIASLTVTQAGS